MDLWVSDTVQVTGLLMWERAAGTARGTGCQALGGGGCPPQPPRLFLRPKVWASPQECRPGARPSPQHPDPHGRKAACSPVEARSDASTQGCKKSSGAPRRETHRVRGDPRSSRPQDPTLGPHLPCLRWDFLLRKKCSVGHMFCWAFGV